MYNNTIFTKTIRLHFHMIYILYCTVYGTVPNSPPRQKKKNVQIYTPMIIKPEILFIRLPFTPSMLHRTNHYDMALLSVSNVLFIP